MRNTGSIGRDHLRVALSLCCLGLSCLLCWRAAIALFGKDDHRVLIALAPLMFASLRHPFLGRFLGWSGLLAQIVVVLRAL